MRRGGRDRKAHRSLHPHSNCLLRQSAEMSDAPIGIFDSGIGGLTVMRALVAQLPEEQFIYLGDTARLPYGTKSGDTVTRYAVQAAGALMKRKVKMLVVACNTASAVALPTLEKLFA